MTDTSNTTTSTTEAEPLTIEPDEFADAVREALLAGGAEAAEADAAADAARHQVDGADEYGIDHGWTVDRIDRERVAVWQASDVDDDADDDGL